MDPEHSQAEVDDKPVEKTAGVNRQARNGATGRLVRLCLKELREILRDRRTIATLVLMPLLIYPLMVILLQKLQMQSMPTEEREHFVVGLADEVQAVACQELIYTGHQILKAREASRAAPNEESEQDTASESVGSDEHLLIDWRVGPDVEQNVAEQRLDVALIFDKDDFSNIELIYRDDSAISRDAARYVEERVRAVKKEELLHLFASRGRDGPRILRKLPETVRHPVLASGPPVSVSAIMPLILILMTITGAVYPAIDLTAGERERGTLETLMAAPVPRLGLLFAKYVAVVTVALLTGGANLLAMGAILLFTGLGGMVLGTAGLSLVLVLQIVALLVLFVAFFSAVLLALTSFARSFKEAQAYLVPVTLLALAPGVVSLMPQIENNIVLSLVPLANLVLLARDLFDGHANPTFVLAAVASSTIYALAAIALAARIFGTDAVLYGSQASLGDLLLRRRTREGKASITAAMLCIAVMFPPYFLLAVMLSSLHHLSIVMRLSLSATITIVLFGGLPWLTAFLQRVRIREAFRLSRARPLAFFGATVLGVSLWPFAYEVFLLNRTLGLTSLTEDRLQLVRHFLVELQTISPWIVLTTMAIIPAIFEEFFFRGYLFTAFRRSFSPTKTILLTALLFGLFHVVVTDMLAMERLLPSTFIGLVLAWVCWRTGSVFPGVILHACHNGFLLMLSHYRDALMARGWGVAEGTHLPATWLAVAVIGVLVGAGIILFAGQRES